MSHIPWVAVVGWACGTPIGPSDLDPDGPAEVSPEPTEPYEPPQGLVALPVGDQLVRVSMALRGVRPTAEDLRSVDADPSLLAGFAETYARDPGFRETIKDMHAELLLVRNDSDEFTLGGTGPLEGTLNAQMHDALFEEPLELVAEVVDRDLPYTEIVTSDWTMANGVTRTIWGMAPDVEGWSQDRYEDGRPHAGILSSSGLWQRHRSQGVNANRGRSNLVTRALLCEDFLDRDVPLSGSIDLADESAVAQAVTTLPECVSCHQALEPIGAYFWGLQSIYLPFNIKLGVSRECAPPYDKFCYPLVGYAAEDEDRWQTEGLRAPAFFGEAVGSELSDLGASIAADPRFSLCTATRFYSYLTQTPLSEVPHEVAASLQASLVASGYDARQLAIDVVTSPEFLASDAYSGSNALPGLQVLRPEQQGRAVQDLTGFAWWFELDGSGCALAHSCWGEVEATHSDTWGFRAMTGGIDGFTVTSPVHAATPTKLLFLAALAQEAAHAVVVADLTSEDPRLLTLVDATTHDEDRLRDQLVELHAALLGELVSADSPEVDGTLALFDSASSDPQVAWTAVVAAMLQSDRFLFY